MCGCSALHRHCAGSVRGRTSWYQHQIPSLCPTKIQKWVSKQFKIVTYMPSMVPRAKRGGIGAGLRCQLPTLAPQSTEEPLCESSLPLRTNPLVAPMVVLTGTGRKPGQNLDAGSLVCRGSLVYVSKDWGYDQTCPSAECNYGCDDFAVRSVRCLSAVRSCTCGERQLCLLVPMKC